jgi:hypothetical protein
MGRSSCLEKGGRQRRRPAKTQVWPSYSHGKQRRENLKPKMESTKYAFHIFIFSSNRGCWETTAVFNWRTMECKLCDSVSNKYYLIFQMVFKAKKSRKQMEAAEKAREHRKERQSVRRSASTLAKKKIAPKFFMGKRVG